MRYYLTSSAGCQEFSGGQSGGLGRAYAELRRVVDELEDNSDAIANEEYDEFGPELRKALDEAGIGEEALSCFCPGDVTVDVNYGDVRMTYDSIPWFAPLLQKALDRTDVGIALVGQPYPDPDMEPWGSVRPFFIVGRNGFETVTVGDVASDPALLSEAIERCAPGEGIAIAERTISRLATKGPNPR